MNDILPVMCEEERAVEEEKDVEETAIEAEKTVEEEKTAEEEKIVEETKTVEEGKAIEEEITTEEEKTVKEEIVLSEDEYLNPEDDLIYCSICKKPKQIWFSSKAYIAPIKLPIGCKCLRDRAEKNLERQLQIEKENKKRELYRLSEFSSSLRNSTFENADYVNFKAMTYAKQYAKQLSEDAEYSQGFLLYGPPGTGKTYIAACIGNYLIQSLYPVLYTSMGRLLFLYNECKFNPETKGNPSVFLKNLLRYRLIILDDLGAEYGSEYENTHLFEIVNFLEINEKPIVVTTNLSPKELTNPGSLTRKRINNRLIGRCVMMALVGEDLREKKARERLEKERVNMEKQTKEKCL